MSEKKETEDDQEMKTIYLLEEGHTISSALRNALESLANPESLVACTVMHPLDSHVEVLSPSVASVRSSLVMLKEECTRLRHTAIMRHA